MVELIALCLLVAALQIVAVGAQSPTFFQVMRLGMPAAGLMLAYGAVQQDAATPWVVAFVLMGLVFFAAPELPRVVWLPINIAIALLMLAFVSQIAWDALL